LPLCRAGAKSRLRLPGSTGKYREKCVALPPPALSRYFDYSIFAEYLHELAVFHYGRFDDQVDAMAQFLDWVKMSGAEDGIYEARAKEAWCGG
jgi:hypothetical protein